MRVPWVRVATVVVQAGVALVFTGLAIALLVYMPMLKRFALRDAWLIVVGLVAWGLEGAGTIVNSAPWWAWITMILIWALARGLSNDHSAVLRQNAYPDRAGRRVTA